METKDGVKTFEARGRKEWRTWLRKNHTKEKSVRLILYKKESSMPTIHYEEAVDEALCFGWIDSKPNKRDEESYYLLFSKRSPKSNWSKANRERAKGLIKQGLMEKAGLDMIELAKKNGTWTALIDVQNSVIPDDLQQALNKNKKALSNFEAFPPSSKRIILEWILNAKKQETREKRIIETVTLAAKNIKANHYRQ
jgi:uncharacterized protein YdeI (YjbR/CyaY-like superfamily)